MDVRALCAPGFAAAATALFAGCASYDAVQPGQSMADVERRLSAPSDKRSDADGGEVWEYNLQPLGRRTWMVTFGADGKVARVEQVMHADHFRKLRDGESTRDDVLRMLGKPGSRHSYSRLGEEVWDYGFYLDTWSMLLSVHFDAASGRLKYYATMPDPAVYTLRAFM